MILVTEKGSQPAAEQVCDIGSDREKLRATCE